MRTIGLIGGMSWESTAEYHRLPNELTRERLAGLNSAHRVIHSVNFAEIERLQPQGPWAEAAEVLAACARSLAGGGRARCPGPGRAARIHAEAAVTAALR